MKSGNLNFLEPSGPLQACKGTTLPFFYMINTPWTMVPTNQNTVCQDPDFHNISVLWGRAVNPMPNMQPEGPGFCISVYSPREVGPCLRSPQLPFVVVHASSGPSTQAWRAWVTLAGSYTTASIALRFLEACNPLCLALHGHSYKAVPLGEG